jgi:hypothetical protein
LLVVLEEAANRSASSLANRCFWISLPIAIAAPFFSGRLANRLGFPQATAVLLSPILILVIGGYGDAAIDGFLRARMARNTNIQYVGDEPFHSQDGIVGIKFKYKIKGPGNKAETFLFGNYEYEAANRCVRKDPNGRMIPNALAALQFSVHSAQIVAPETKPLLETHQHGYQVFRDIEVSPDQEYDIEVIQTLGNCMPADGRRWNKKKFIATQGDVQRLKVKIALVSYSDGKKRSVMKTESITTNAYDISRMYEDLGCAPTYFCMAR